MTNLIDTLRDRAHDLRSDARRTATRARSRLEPRPSPWRVVAAAWLGAVAGALAAFLLDPHRGRARRAQAIDRSAAVARRGARAVAGALRGARAAAEGRIAATRATRGGDRLMNDAELAHAVETELFRDASVPKGRINVNVESGVVILRGEVDEAEQRASLERLVEGIDGVWSVRNLLHLPGEPAAEAELASLPR